MAAFEPELVVAAEVFAAPGPTSRVFSSAKKLLGNGPEFFGPVAAGADPVAPVVAGALFPVAGAAAVVVPVVPAPVVAVDPVEPEAAGAVEPALDDVEEALVVAGAFGAPGPTSRTFSSAKKLLGKGPESLGPVEAGADPVAPAPAGAPLAAAGAEAPVVPVAGGGVDPLAPAVVDPEEFVGEDEVAAEAEFDPLAAEVVEPEVAAGVDPV